MENEIKNIYEKSIGDGDVINGKVSRSGRRINIMTEIVLYRRVKAYQALMKSSGDSGRMSDIVQDLIRRGLDSLTDKEDS